MNNARQLIYKLKRSGKAVSISWFHFISKTTDLDSGLMQNFFLSQIIRKAIALPEKTNRQYIYDLSFVAANKNFTYGGHFDKAVRDIIIDPQDLSLGIFPSINDLIDIGPERYEVKGYLTLDVDHCLILNATRLKIEDRVTESGVILPSLNKPSTLIGPAVTSGFSGGETIQVGSLVFQDGQNVYLADYTNEDRPAIGVVTEVTTSGAVKHVRTATMSSLFITGGYYGDGTLWLDTNGQATFQRPETGLKQKVGFITGENDDGTYQVTFSISDVIVSSGF